MVDSFDEVPDSLAFGSTSGMTGGGVYGSETSGQRSPQVGFIFSTSAIFQSRRQRLRRFSRAIMSAAVSKYSK